MLIVGFDTLPSLMTGFPAMRLSVGLVVSRSSPMSVFSPGAPCGQSSMTLAGSATRQPNDAKEPKHMRATQRVKVDFMLSMKPISSGESKLFVADGPVAIQATRD